MGRRGTFLGRLRRGSGPAVRTAGCTADPDRGPVIMSRPMRIAAQLGVATMALAAAGWLGGCSRSAQDVAAAHGLHSGKSQDTTSAKPGNGIDPDMVNAVSAAGTSTTPISMKFKLGGRPQVT